jgi:hypothetical protein
MAEKAMTQAKTNDAAVCSLLDVLLTLCPLFLLERELTHARSVE